MISCGIPLLKPMLAVSSEPFDSEDYYFEIKWDGYRCLCYVNGDVRLFSRNGLELTQTFPELAFLSESISDKPAVLDGEIIVLDNGIPSFNRLQTRGRLKDEGKIRHAAATNPAIFVAFDVLYVSGNEIMDKPLKERKDILRDSVKVNHHFLISDYILGQGKQFVSACASRGLEGVMAKRITSPYLPGKRSHYWKKIRNIKEADLVICGYQQGKGSKMVGSLVLAGFDGNNLVYQGKVGSGFDQREERIILDRLNEILTKEPAVNIPVGEKRNTIWVKPVLVCTVHYLALTGEGLLRHPVYKGIRQDKLPEECKVLKN